MLGQIVYSAGRRGKVRLEETQIMGLPVLQVSLDPEGYWARRRLQKAGRLLIRAGVRRVLVPEGFENWEALERCTLRCVDPLPFLRSQAAPLALAAVRRQGKVPNRCAVALRGIRADVAVVQAAEELCPQVRDVCISVLRGGQSLSDRLRWEYGVAVCPDFSNVAAAVRFDPRTWDQGGEVLNLFPPEASLCGGGIALPGLEQVETEPLPLLAALWEVGKVQKRDLEFT